MKLSPKEIKPVRLSRGVSAPIVDIGTQDFLDRVDTHPACLSAYYKARLTVQFIDSSQTNAQVETFPLGSDSRFEGRFIRIFRPRHTNAALPTVLYFHGGEYEVERSHAHDRWLGEVANRSGTAIISVDDSLGPACDCKARLENAITVATTFAAKSRELLLDWSRLMLVGDGIGANTANAFAEYVVSHRQWPLCLQVLITPLFPPVTDTPSRRVFETGPWINLAVVDAMSALLIGAEDGESKEDFSPRSSLRKLRDLPPTMIITAENDPLRDEAEDFGHALLQAGIDVVVTRFQGAIHDFLILDALVDTVSSRVASAQLVAALRSGSLGGDPSLAEIR